MRRGQEVGAARNAPSELGTHSCVPALALPTATVAAFRHYVVGVPSGILTAEFTMTTPSAGNGLLSPNGTGCIANEGSCRRL
jgi:hypothetical protein